MTLGAYAKTNGVKYFLVSFVDLCGVMRAKLVPATAIDGICDSGAGFAGFAAWFDMTPADPDVLVIPDPSTVIQLPWKREVAWVTGDLFMGGRPVEQNPRQVLKRAIADARSLGFELRTGVECEYFLVAKSGDQVDDAADRQPKPCYDQQSLMRRYEVVTEICDAMIELGWQPYQNDHEDANGQFEMNWHYDECLKTADRHAFFKYMTKSIAEKHGLRATFMPKPFAALTGSGCHAHVSLWNDGRNQFLDPAGELGLSKLAYSFIGGLIHSADALAAITNP
ncbi:MAG: type III glutamate--ammonia ligase, partial [Hyphomicrobiaceae bacterium]|nr:type III glutamate--ammonia ligase [Hyphomicrobiaceae bacterium]